MASHSRSVADAQVCSALGRTIDCRINNGLNIPSFFRFSHLQNLLSFAKVELMQWRGDGTQTAPRFNLSEIAVRGINFVRTPLAVLGVAPFNAKTMANAKTASLKATSDFRVSNLRSGAVAVATAKQQSVMG